MSTEIMAVGQTPATSSTVTVTFGETKLITIYTDTAGLKVPSGVDLLLQRKNHLGHWQDVYDVELGLIRFTSRLLNVNIVAAGEYRVLRENIEDIGVNIGVSVD